MTLSLKRSGTHESLVNGAPCATTKSVTSAAVVSGTPSTTAHTTTTMKETIMNDLDRGYQNYGLLKRDWG